MTIFETNSRREKRVAFAMRAAVEFASGERRRIDDSVTIDLSASGVCLRLTGEVQPGQVVELHISPKPEPCRVVWTRPAGPRDEKFVGLEFICPLPDVRHRKTPTSSRFEPVQ
jgi:hypothetical protein